MEAGLVVFRPGRRINGPDLRDGLVHHIEDGLRFVRVFLLPGGFSLLLFGLEGDVGRRHAPGLLFLGNGGEGVFGDRPVPPAIVADVLGKLVEAQDLAQGVPGLADDAAQLLLGVFLLRYEGLQAFGLFDGGEVLALEIFDERDFSGVAVDEDAGNFGETDQPGGGDTAFTGHDDGRALRAAAENDRLNDPVLCD